MDIASDTDLPTGAYLLQFYLIGDTKGVFQLLGRSGYDSSYCVFCKCRSKTWKEKYSLRIGAYSDICVRAEDWTIEDINRTALYQAQETSAGRNFASVGVRDYPLISFIPIKRVLPPILHLLLGLGNDIYANFKEFIADRVEKVSIEEMDARDMSILAEIKYEDSALLYLDAKSEVQMLVQDRIVLNSRVKERGLSRDIRASRQ